MTSGIDFDEESTAGAMLYYTTDLRSLMHTYEVRTLPGQHYAYGSVSAQLLWEVLQESRIGDHRTVAGYFEERLWDPLGAEQAAAWSLDSADKGVEKFSSGLSATVQRLRAARRALPARGACRGSPRDLGAMGRRLVGSGRGRWHRAHHRPDGSGVGGMSGSGRSTVARTLREGLQRPVHLRRRSARCRRRPLRRGLRKGGLDRALPSDGREPIGASRESLENRLQVSGERRFEDQALSRLGVIELDSSAMQERPVEPVFLLEEPVRRRVAIARVAEHWMADRREVAADLMRPALPGDDLDEPMAAGSASLR